MKALRDWRKLFEYRFAEEREKLSSSHSSPPVSDRGVGRGSQESRLWCPSARMTQAAWEEGIWFPGLLFQVLLNPSIKKKPKPSAPFSFSFQ